MSSGWFIRPLAGGMLTLACVGPAVALGLVLGAGFLTSVAVAGTVYLTAEVVNHVIRTAL